MGALNLLAATTTNKERPVYISLMGICWGSGTVLGPVVGGAFADSSATWRWSFYINLVIGAVAAPAYILLLPPTNTHLREVKLLDRIRFIDWVGTVLISGAVVSGIMGVNFGGVLFAWNSGTIIGCFVCSGVLWILFGLQQGFSVFTTPEDRIFPCDIIRNWEADVLFAQTASGLGASIVAIYFIPVSNFNPVMSTFTNRSALFPIRSERKGPRRRYPALTHDVPYDIRQHPDRHLPG